MPTTDPPPDLDAILTWLLRLEDSTLSGHTVILPDGAGLTRFGITQAADSSLVPADFWTIPTPDALVIAKAFYKSAFWDALGLASQPMPFAASVLSCAVNCGKGCAEPMMRAALLTTNPVTQFVTLWSNHYKSIVIAHPQDQQFLKGWLARALSIYPLLPGQSARQTISP